jgi:hypothetical protein
MAVSGSVSPAAVFGDVDQRAALGVVMDRISQAPPDLLSAGWPEQAWMLRISA